MKNPGLLSAALLAGMLAVQAQPILSTPTLQRIAGAQVRGASLAVSAPDGALVFTGQVLASEPTPDARRQTEQALDQLGLLFARAGANLQSVLRLNVYVANDEATTAVEEVIAKRFADAPPAVTIVRSPLARENARVALDAVAAGSRAVSKVEHLENAAIMPAGAKAFVSGQARKGGDLSESVQLTMESLHRSLAHIGLTPAEVVQVKAFIRPFSDYRSAIAQIEKNYAGGKVPPIVLLEWLTGSPTEIELVAAVPPSRAATEARVEYLSLPEMTTSPLYCRIAVVKAGVPLVFISGITGSGRTPRDEWKDAFAQLGGALFEAGSSFRHLAKATYYLTDEGGRQSLGAIRPTFYDPARPPAASALEVSGLGRPGGRMMLDMIAVPVR